MENVWKVFLVISISFFCYCNTIFGTFVFDDTEAIVKNKDVLPATSLYNTFQNDFWGTDISLNISHKSYRPLTILSYRLNILFADSKFNELHFHLINVILYLILCVLVFYTFRIFLNKKGDQKSDIPFLSSLLFSVHPVHTEVVASLVGRADLLSSILFFISILLYHKLLTEKKSPVYFIFIAMTISAATLCKETGITTLAVCVIYDIINSKVLNKTMTCSSLIKSLLFCRCCGLLLMGIIILYFRLQVMNFEGPIFTTIDNPAAFSKSIFTKVATYNYIYAINFLLLLWPQWLCFDWSMGCIPLIDEFCDSRLIIVVLFWAFMLLCSVTLFKKLKNSIRSIKPVIMGVVLLLIPFLPSSNIFFKVGFVIAERSLFLPSAGFCFLIVLGFKNLENNTKLKKLMYYASFYTICIIFAIRTVQRNIDWLTEETLFSSALSVCPLNAKVHYNVAKVAADNNNRKLAIDEYRLAIELNPQYEQAMNNLANLLRDEKKFEEAENWLRLALAIRPNFAAAWMNLGIVLTNLNQSEEAQSCYITAISHRKKYPDCYYNLGNLYLDLKQNGDALEAWEKAVFYRPTHTAAWSNMLVLLDSLHRYHEVLKLGRTALMHNPHSAPLHFSIGNTLGKLQQFEKAEKHFLEALNLSPSNALYYSNLGVLYHRWGQSEKAREMYRKALQLDPNLKTAASNLRKLLSAQNILTK